MQLRLHRKYGVGLTSLTDRFKGMQSGGQENISSNGWERSATINFNDFDVDDTSWKALPLGIVAGLQYNMDTNGKCFYAVADTEDFLEIMWADLLVTQQGGGANLYQAMIYNPTRLSSNLAAIYE